MVRKIPVPACGTGRYSVTGTNGTIKLWSITEGRLAGDSFETSVSALIPAFVTKPFAFPFFAH